MSLQTLPPELTERIVVLLPLSDIGSLRLTNKGLASQTAQTHLKARFWTKRVELTEQRLRTFVAVTASGGLGCLLQNLTIVAPVYNTSELAARIEKKTALSAKLNDDGKCYGIRRWDLTEEELRQTELDLVVLQKRLAEQTDLQRRRRDIELLGQALSNLAAHGVSLRILRTEVEIYKDDTTTPLLPLFGGSETPIWASAGHVSRTLFASLAACDLPIQSLDLFNNSRMRRCSLACNDLNSIDFASARLNSSLGHLAALSLRISDYSADQSCDEVDSESARQEPNLDGLRSLLRTCSNIQNLDLVHFSMIFVKRQEKQHRRIFQTLGESGLRSLQCLALQGFDVTEHELLTLLQCFGTLRSLSLCYIHLSKGSFKRIFDYCTMEAAMEELELDTLFEAAMVQFEPPWVVRGRPKELQSVSGDALRTIRWAAKSNITHEKASELWTHQPPEHGVRC